MATPEQAGETPRRVRIEEPRWQWNGIVGDAPWYRDALDDVHYATDEDLNALEASRLSAERERDEAKRDLAVLYARSETPGFIDELLAKVEAAESRAAEAEGKAKLAIELYEHLLQLRERLNNPLVFAAVHGYESSEDDVAFGMAGTELIERARDSLTPEGRERDGD